MCIAIVKPKGCKLPKREWLENSFESNPDGGGFAVLKPNHNEVGYMKGYFNFEEYYKVLKDSIKTEDVALIHMRITTHGGTSAECCHPFPITQNTNVMRKVNGRAKKVLIHNGVLGGSFASKSTEGVSDTMVMTKYIARAGFKQYGSAFKVLMKPLLTGNKVAVLDENGFTLAGSGWKEETDGNYYSNDTYNYSWGSYGIMGGWRGWTNYDKPTKKKKKYSKFSFNQNQKVTKMEGGWERRDVNNLSKSDQNEVAFGTCPACLNYMPSVTYENDYFCRNCNIEWTGVERLCL